MYLVLSNLLEKNKNLFIISSQILLQIAYICYTNIKASRYYLCTDTRLLYTVYTDNNLNKTNEQNKHVEAVSTYTIWCYCIFAKVINTVLYLQIS